MAAKSDKLTFTSGRPLLHYAAQPIIIRRRGQMLHAPHLTITKLLLEAGCDPNETWHGMSAWKTLLLGWEELTDPEHGDYGMSLSDLLPFWDTFMVLVEHGSRGTVDTPRRLTAIVEYMRQYHPITGYYEKEELEILDNKLKKLLEGLAKNNQLPMPLTFQVLWWLITSGRFDFLK